MAVFDEVDGEVVAYVKGAPARLIELSERRLTTVGDKAAR